MTISDRLETMRTKENQTKLEHTQMEREKKKFEQELQTNVRHNEAFLAQLQQDYNNKKTVMEGQLEEKLQALRTAHATRMREENERLNQELENLTKAQKDRLNELRNSNSVEVDRVTASHKETLERAEDRFRREQNKLKGAT